MWCNPLASFQYKPGLNLSNSVWLNTHHTWHVFPLTGCLLPPPPLLLLSPLPSCGRPPSPPPPPPSPSSPRQPLPAQRAMWDRRALQAHRARPGGCLRMSRRVDRGTYLQVKLSNLNGKLLTNYLNIGKFIQNLSQKKVSYEWLPPAGVTQCKDLNLSYTTITTREPCLRMSFKQRPKPRPRPQTLQESPATERPSTKSPDTAVQGSALKIHTAGLLISLALF